MDGLSAAGAPSMSTSPADGASSPAIMWRTVVFPAPLGPSTPVTPGPSAQETSLTATTFPYQRDAWRSSRRGPGAGGVYVWPAASVASVLTRPACDTATRAWRLRRGSPRSSDRDTIAAAG